MPEERQLFSLDGLVCLVTGAGSGIGQATARVLRRQGAVVAVNDIDGSAASETARLIGSPTDPAQVGNVTDPEEAARVVDAVVSRHGRLDVLVNNAAAPVELSPFIDVPTAAWPAYLSSLFATLACTRAVLPHMTRQGWGRIVNVTSIAGTVGVDRMVLYGAGKGGIHAFTAGLAKEIAASGITINCVAPGTVDTPRQRSRAPEERARRMERVPVGRFAEAEEVGAAIAYLASREAAYVTGEVLYLDGGRP
jgi:NAD(P)-dependent dehydrogenase (short-subunit alcohol dehydrogenase family)